MTAPSQTLSSHISIINKRNEGNKTSGKNSQGKSSVKGQGRNKPNRENSRKNENGSYRDPKKNNHPNRHRQNNDARGKGPSNSPSPTTSPATAKTQPGSGQKKVANLEPFDLFCAYHLGIGPNKQYKPANINEVANRFRQEPGVIRQALKEYGMDSASLLDKDFDMALAQLDIQVAPEGVDRLELAKTIYEDYLEAPYQKRDWKKILDEDRLENRKIFGG
ncbi:hypothetical protein MNBD_NITROSPINAE05-862 [hydrothermal vent metagenome]|uniref:Uncharacterized protein n=1 Tax=hydrothermal vent metagenome TaxID=652676 RepID=A0A3B1CS01_9ZZZZ